MFSFPKKILVLFLSIIQIIVPFVFTLGSNADANFEDWSVDDAYTLDYTTVLEKQAGEDFVVLNLTDIQLGEGEALTTNSDYSFALIDELVKRSDPDLITVSGDNLLGFVGTYSTLEKLSSLGIPYAIVMGNHDGQDTITEDWAAYMAANAENSLFKFGPKDMGYGNYIINIRQGDEIVHTLYMMDTHDYASFTKEDGSVVEGYDHLWDNQFDWYEWAVKGLADLEGKTVQSTVIFHIPVVEYTDAWNAAFDANTNAFRPEYADSSFGVKLEDVCSAPVNNGFFDLVKELGSTKDIIVGHDHKNSFSVPYEGVRLSYGLKTGFGSYAVPEENGGSVLTIHDDGTTTFEHIYIAAEELGYDGNKMP